MPLFGLIAIIIIFSFLTGGKLLSARNLSSLFNQCFLLMIACIGSIFIFSQGGIDMSITSAISLCSICAAYTIRYGIVLSIFASLAAGLAVGLLNGLIYSRSNIPVFIQTLSVNLLLDGLLYSLTNQNVYIAIPRAIQKTYNATWIKLLVLALFALLTLYLYRYTVFGKYSRAIGAGKTATEQSGVNVKRFKLLAFIYTGFAASIFAVCVMVKSGSEIGRAHV
jgi:ribose transport system permease protein